MNTILDADWYPASAPTMVQVEGIGECFLLTIDMSHFTKEQYDGKEFFLSNSNNWVVYTKDDTLFLRLND